MVSLTAILVVGVNQIGVAPVGAAAREQFTPRELFDGLILGMGPVAEQHPELNPATIAPAVARDQDEKDEKASRELATRLVDNIEAENPGFLPSFATNVTSGDPYVVQASVEDAAQKLVDAYEAVTGTDPRLALGANSTRQAEPEVYLDIYAVGYAVIFIFVAVIDTTPRAASQETELGFERWVGRTAVTLAS